MRNSANGVDRWRAAMEEYHQTGQLVNRTEGKVSINALIDISSSMEGTKLTAVKLGLCALVANLLPDDEMNIIAFSHVALDLTNGFQTIAHLRSNNHLPQLLRDVREGGSTACYDTISNAVTELRAHAQHDSKPNKKNIIITLTDGEDNSSFHTGIAVKMSLELSISF